MPDNGHGPMVVELVSCLSMCRRTIPTWFTEEENLKVSKTWSLQGRAKECTYHDIFSDAADLLRVMVMRVMVRMTLVMTMTEVRMTINKVAIAGSPDPPLPTTHHWEPTFPTC